jgi:multicomponent Na+:H+ antiporter subunit A
VITVLAMHFAVAAVAPFLFRKFGRNTFYFLASVPGASFAWLILQHAAVYPDSSANPAGKTPPAGAVSEIGGAFSVRPGSA